MSFDSGRQGGFKMGSSVSMRVAETGDFERWHEFLLNSPDAHILQSTIMAQVFKEISFRPFLVLAERGNDIVGGLMSFVWFGGSKIPFVKFFSRLYSHYGPVLSSNMMNGTLLKEMLQYISREVESQTLMDHRMSIPYRGIERVLEALGYSQERYTPRYIHTINLRRSKQELSDSLESRCRRAIKRAERKGVTIEEGLGKDTPIIFHRLYVDTAKRLGIYPNPYSFIESIWKVLVPKKHAKFFFAYYNGEPIAGISTLYYKDRVYYYMGASLKDRWNVSPNNRLHWHAMLDAKGMGYNIYDLMSSPGKEEVDNPEYGLYLFKRSFGGSMSWAGATYRKVFLPYASRLWDSFLVPSFRKFSFISKYL